MTVWHYSGRRPVWYEGAEEEPTEHEDEAALVDWLEDNRKSLHHAVREITVGVIDGGAQTDYVDVTDDVAKRLEAIEEHHRTYPPLVGKSPG